MLVLDNLSGFVEETETVDKNKQAKVKLVLNRNQQISVPGGLTYCAH